MFRDCCLGFRDCCAGQGDWRAQSGQPSMILWLLPELGERQAMPEVTCAERGAAEWAGRDGGWEFSRGIEEEAAA